MLDELDDIAWNELHHAYGAADDVPGLLRALADGDADGEALHELFGNIHHQGTVYEATAYAVPFLVALLDLPGTDTAGILGLLSAIAEGDSYADAHRHLTSTLANEDPEFAATVERELSWCRAARTAVAAGAPGYLRLLATAPDEDVRACAAHTLGVSVEATDPAVPALLERVGVESSPLVRASLVLAAGALDAATPALLSRWLTDPAAPTRLAAALVAARAADPATPADRVSTVLERDAPASLDTLSELPWSAAGGGPLLWVVEQLADRPELQLHLLARWMRDDRGEVRTHALYAAEYPIGEGDLPAARLVPTLARCLTDPERDVRYWAANLLAGCGADAAGAADELWALVRREGVRHNEPGASALTALCRLRDPRAATYLSGRLTAEPVDLSGLDDPIRLIGSWAEGCLVPLLRLIPLAPAGNARIGIISAVGRLHDDGVDLPPETVTLVRQQLDSHPHITTRLLGDLGPAAADAAPDLRPMLSHDEPIVRINAARALWRIAGEPDALLAVARTAIGAGRSYYLGWALDALAELGPAGVELSGRLPALFEYDDDRVRVRAAVAYWKLTGDPDPVVPVLRSQLGADERGLLALRCLTEIGPAAGAAAPDIRKMAGETFSRAGSTGVGSSVDSPQEWAAACAEALDRIEATGPR